MIYIGTYAFNGCSNLRSINYAGTKSEWKNITLEQNWGLGTRSLTVYCTDGSIQVT
jgi:hypothetical protein